MTKLQRMDMAQLLGVSYANRTFERQKVFLVNHYDSRDFDYIYPVKIRNINTKLAIKLWKLL